MIKNRKIILNEILKRDFNIKKSINEGWFYNLISNLADATDSSKVLLPGYKNLQQDLDILNFQKKVQKQTALMSKLIVKGTNQTYSQYMEIHYGKNRNETLYDFIARSLKEGKKLPNLTLVSP